MQKWVEERPVGRFPVGLCGEPTHLGGMIRILFIGDIVGRPGRDIIASRVSRLRSKLNLDFVIANGENAAAGAGITGAIAKTLLGLGIDALTLGDHVWDQRGWEDEITGFPRVCRPANLPLVCPGRDHVILEKGSFRLVVFTLLGRSFMGMKAEDPFDGADAMLKRTVGAGLADAALVEIHAEATSEKIALGWHLDGRVAAVLGTHTHVPTADAEVRPQGTAYLTDVGMTGAYRSVLGREIKPVVERFITGMPQRFGVAEEDVRLSGAFVEYDPERKRATRCELVVVRQNSNDA
jgi:2',3'-cyclic-nucleotide 2'-phosphodiesterase